MHTNRLISALLSLDLVQYTMLCQIVQAGEPRTHAFPWGKVAERSEVG